MEVGSSAGRLGDLERIDREIEAVERWLEREPDSWPCWLWAMGFNDLLMERDLILDEIRQAEAK
ncbi:MAG TPA: hypothetical protein VFO46_02265 [Candidatus Sulfotelmatobacter sp.]|nr:hypothetical protein [Candidatus Sulfotelmatobacter sp.]